MGAMLRSSWWAHWDPPMVLLILEASSPSLKCLHAFHVSVHAHKVLEKMMVSHPHG